MALSRTFRQADDAVDDGLERFPAFHDGAEHNVFGKFLGFGFNHQNAFLRSGDNEIQVAVLDSCMVGLMTYWPLM
jgi:hypothetical protein